MLPLEGLAVKYTGIESITGNEGKLAEEVARDLQSIGWTVQRIPLFTDSTRVNLLATKGSGPKRLVLNTHLDTVPPFIPPSQDEHNIYGRGSNETKGQLAAIITAANILAEREPEIACQVCLLFVVGEEVDHIGMTVGSLQNPFSISKVCIKDIQYVVLYWSKNSDSRRVFQEGSRLVGDEVEYLIVGEPTELKFATVQKGALKVLLKAEGIAGHSGYPSAGESAIHKLVPVLNALLSHSWPSDPVKGDTTVNIGVIRGGQAQNAWAAEASANIFFRVTTSVEDIMSKLRVIVSERCLVEILSFNEPVVLSPSPLAAFGETQAAFNTDIAYYQGLEKLKGKFLFGAGSIKNAFSEHEFMPKKELHIYVKALTELIPKLLK